MTPSSFSSGRASRSASAKRRDQRETELPANGYERRSQATRARLLSVGRRAFATEGYDRVAAETLVAAAGLSRGALYHHFDGKLGLFAAVHEMLHAEVAARIASAAERASDPWHALVAGSQAFLDACADHEFQQVALLDAPSVLGWDAWRAVDAAFGMGLLRLGLEEATAGGFMPPRSTEELDALTHLLSGAMNEAGMWMARAADVGAARRVAGAQIELLLRSLRQS